MWQGSRETEDTPGYDPRASIPAPGFLPNPNVLTRRRRRRHSEDSTPLSGENTNINLPPREHRVPSEEHSALPESGVPRIRLLND